MLHKDEFINDVISRIANIYIHKRVDYLSRTY